MSRSWLAAVAAVVLVLAGCSSAATPAAPAPSRTEAPAPPPALTVQQALGDLPTIDYCTLLDAAKATATGGLTLESPVSAPDECFVRGKLAGQEVLLTVGELGSSGADPDRIADVTARGLDRGLKIQATSYESPTGCRHYLTFADGTHLATDVEFSDDSAGVDQRAALCPVADALLDGLITHVTAGDAGHRPFAAGSTGAADACAVLGDVRAAAPGPMTDALKSVPVLTHHHCTWLNGSDYSQIELSFDYGNVTGGTSVRIAGHTSVTDPGDSQCSLSTQLAAAPVSGFHQIAQLYVRTPDQSTDACAVARTVAAAVWPRLPAA